MTTIRLALRLFLLLLIFVVASDATASQPLFTYTLALEGGESTYDEAIAAASLEGIINRDSPQLYLLSRKDSRPQYWLGLLSKKGRWLHGRKQIPLPDLDALVKLARPNLKGAVIWDPAVPASVNVATTIAGVENAVVLSPSYADRYLGRWRLPVLKDLRGQFTGAETGSRKNDAYRWAIREYLAKGRCSPHLLCLFEDSFATRSRGDIGYVDTRDWAVNNRAFVFDLSPWGDEKPGDDPNQPLGADLATYKMILAETQRCAAGQQMTELNGFFAFSKYSQTADHPSAHDGVPTEWESVWLMSPYNCYQNTITSDCYNQSFHSHATRRPLKQTPAWGGAGAASPTLQKKAYICIQTGDYDSSTPLYDFLPQYWNDPNRGKIPLTWGINPNQLESYPDLMAYFYSTATPADTFAADASAAGYMNPSRIAHESLPLFVKHNQRLFREADMTIASMVLDRTPPSSEVKDAFQQFAPDGYATIIDSCNPSPPIYPPPQVWKGMPIIELLNDTCNSKEPEQIASAMGNAIRRRGNHAPAFYFFRVTWVSPTKFIQGMAELRRVCPDIDFEVLDAKTFFALYKKSL